MTQYIDKTKVIIARNAASTWCMCFECDGIVRTTHNWCDKKKLMTCHQWYDGYRTALIALNDDRLLGSL